ncbi:MAG: extracellular solute-binding protein [Bacilli bacterium]
MNRNSLKKSFAIISVALLIGSDSMGVATVSQKQANRLYALNLPQVTLSVYNSDDYIAEDEVDEDGNIEKGLVSQFQDYCLEELGQNVYVAYSTFDTNETMLSELKTGKATYDIVCPSDYIIQKMIKEDLIVEYDEDSTPNYDKYVSPFVSEKMGSISVNGQEGLVNKYARGYMWGTLGILYNNNFPGVTSRGITAEEMDEDMTSWLSLWNSKYETLLSIKDSMRDTYAVGIMKAYNSDFEIGDVSYEGFETLKTKYDNGIYSAEEYNEKANTIFNLCDNVTLDRVEAELNELKDNSFGFEVDSGKTDMAKGDVFAINVAWSGDAAYAMDLADENNEKNAEVSGYVPTVLKYALPDNGANIWFDGWVIPKNVKQKALAQEFVDFISDPVNVAQNMEYIGYTSVIGGYDVLSLILSWYDMRWDEEMNDGDGGIDESVIEEYTLVNSSDIASLDDEELESSYYVKDISYFFSGTLDEYSNDSVTFCITADCKNRQFDTQYPDSSLLPGLCIMADFGNQTDSLLKMWENVKNTNLPLWAYILICVSIVGLIGFYIFSKIRKRQILNDRRKRKLARELKNKRTDEMTKILTEDIA